MIKRILKKITPNFLLEIYYKSFSMLGKFIYGNSSNKLIVIGVTGTNGKSTVVNLISHILTNAGYITGHSSTVGFKIADKVWLNDKKMTMLGRFALQKFLKKMVDANCDYAIIETSSEGIKQYRHLGINYDVVVFTNLTPEHLESHGGFENYKNCKLELFRNLNNLPRKNLSLKSIPGIKRKIDKVVIVNKDDMHYADFFDVEADKKLGFSLNKESDFRAVNISYENFQTEFDLQDTTFLTNLIGDFNVYNSLAAISVCNSQGISLPKISEYIRDFQGVAGRMEFINEGQNFKILIDYAPEVESLRNLYSTINLFSYGKLIHVLGSCGGGRDRDRQPVLGQMAGEKADIVIVTNEDPYDDDPMEIIDNVSSGAIESGKTLEKDLFKFLDRREAMKKAFELAEEGDLVLITGKGSEQFICVKNNMKIPWDDRKVARELLKSL